MGNFVIWFSVILLQLSPADVRVYSKKCTKVDFSWGYTADPTGGGACNTPQTLAGFNGLFTKGQWRRREGTGEKGHYPIPFWNPKYATVFVNRTVSPVSVPVCVCSAADCLSVSYSAFTSFASVFFLISRLQSACVFCRCVFPSPPFDNI